MAVPEILKRNADDLAFFKEYDWPNKMPPSVVALYMGVEVSTIKNVYMKDPEFPSINLDGVRGWFVFKPALDEYMKQAHKNRH